MRARRRETQPNCRWRRWRSRCRWRRPCTWIAANRPRRACSGSQGPCFPCTLCVSMLATRWFGMSSASQLVPTASHCCVACVFLLPFCQPRRCNSQRAPDGPRDGADSDGRRPKADGPAILSATASKGLRPPAGSTSGAPIGRSKSAHKLPANGKDAGGVVVAAVTAPSPSIRLRFVCSCQRP